MTALQIVRALHFATVLQLVGLLTACLIFVPAGFFGARFRPLALIASSAAIAATLLWFPFEATSISGESAIEALGDGTFGTVLTATRFGQVWVIRLALLAVTAIVLVSRGRAATFLAALTASAALALSALTGHAGAASGFDGAVELGADMLHLLAAAVWVGGLLPLAWIMARPGRSPTPQTLGMAVDAARRFSPMGIACVGTLLVTGGVNTWFLSGNLPALIGTDYGRLLSLKIILFFALVAVAAANRFRLTPRLASGSAKAATALRRNALVEAGIGLAIVAIVGVLGTLPPGAHDQPVWPLSFRVAWTPLPEIEEAFPTSFAHSPIAFAAPSVARGETIYAANCAVCHGRDGRGDGPGAAGLPIKPADLAAPHLRAHSDGDLFWWIGHGKRGIMPAFESVLSEDERWDVINFVRALNAGAAARSLPARVGETAAPILPDFAFDTGSGQMTARQMLRRAALLLVLVQDDDANGRIRDLVALAPRLRERGLAVLLVSLDGPNSPAIPVTPDVAAMLSLFLGANEPEAEYLVDANGYARARWSMAAGPLPGADALIAELERANRVPLARAAEHHH